MMNAIHIHTIHIIHVWEVGGVQWFSCEVVHNVHITQQLSRYRGEEGNYNESEEARINTANADL